MSHDLIRQAALGRAFDPEPLPESLPVCHIPFLELVGEDVEAELTERLLQFGRVGVTGPVGAGKSSLVRYVLDDERFAPVFVNVAIEDPDKVSEPRGFLEVLVAQLSRAAHRAGELSESQRQALLRQAAPTETLQGEERAARSEVSASAWLLSGRVADDLKTTLPAGAAYATTDRVLDAARDAVQAIAAHDRLPVLVADDTDRLLRLPDETVREKVFNGFFGEVLRVVVDSLETALVVAVHDHYRDDEALGYAQLVEGRIEHHLRIPRLTSSAHLRALIDGRGQFMDDPATCDDLLDADAVDELLALHQTRHEHNLRQTYVLLKGAFGLASAAGADRTGTQHIAAAVAG
jgi:hypothetical protein